MKTALLIIDMQRGPFDETPKFDAAGLVRRINRLAESVRGSGGDVIFIQHKGPEGDPLHPGQPGWRLLPDLAVGPSDVIVGKSSCDSFLHTALAEVLQERGTEQLIITGFATDYCVDTTVRSALGRGIPTIVPSDGHTTSDRGYLTATQVIEHHNAIWRDFIAPNGPARVMACAEVAL